MQHVVELILMTYFNNAVASFKKINKRPYGPSLLDAIFEGLNPGCRALQCSGSLTIQLRQREQLQCVMHKHTTCRIKVRRIV